jgi:CRP-like cAMP-binding protein
MREGEMQFQTRTAELPCRPRSSGHSLDIARDGAWQEDALELLEQFGTHQSLRRGQELYGAGDPSDCCYRVLRGCIRTVDIDEDGRRQVTEFLLPGDVFGLDSLGTHHLSAEALTDAVVVCYPRRVVEGLAVRHGALALRLREITAESLRRAHQKMFLLGRKSAGERIASFLLELEERARRDGGGCIDLPMTRSDIADHLGLTIETVSRNMAQLCRSGIITAVKAGIEIRNRQALASFGADTRH